MTNKKLYSSRTTISGRGEAASIAKSAISTPAVENSTPQLNIHKYKCLRCNHTWIPRINSIPQACPNCTSRVWFKEKKNDTNNIK